jgi:signal transduction histidine kinase
MLELSREEVVGHSIEHFSEIFAGSANSWLETIKAWMKKSDSIRAFTTFSEQLSLKNGSVLSVSLASVMNDGEFFGTVSVLRDITHLIEVDRLKSEFVATVSHELRTPMTSIKGYVDIMLMGAAGEMSGEQIRFLEVVQQNTERLTILVNDLLDLSRIEAGQVKLEHLPIELDMLIEESMEEIQRLSRTENKALKMMIDIPTELPSVAGDPDRVSQILINLLNNAYYYTPSDGQIKIQARCVGEEIQVDIRDTGVGIPPNEQDRIFERFYRGDNHMVYASSGTGLGLSIVQKLIQMHHGRIWVQSSGIPGEGSIFSFTLPIYEHSQFASKVREEYAENTNC